MVKQRLTALAALFLGAIFASAMPQQPATSAVPRQAEAAAQSSTPIREFGLRVISYLEARKHEAGSLPKPTNSATKLKESREQIRARVQANRSDAKQGNIFGGEVGTYFRRQISSVMQGPEGGRVRASLRRSEPVKPTPLRVNQPYPAGLALQSMPPTLLQKLPKLPKELEYRIVGHNLVLLDTEPNLVVDVLPNALPTA
jgi:hypothetical protein